MKRILFPIGSPESIVELIDKIEKEFWPEVPQVTYQVAGAGSRENAKALMRQYLTEETEKVKGIYWALVGSMALLGGMAGYMAGTWTDANWSTSRADMGLAILGGVGMFFYALLSPPRRVDIIFRLRQGFEEGRYSAVPALPEEEEIPFEMARSGNTPHSD